MLGQGLHLSLNYFFFVFCLLFYLTITGLPLYLETWKNLEFGNLYKKNLEFLTIFTFKQKNFDLTQKIHLVDKFFCHHQNFFLLKCILKVALQYFFNVFILSSTVFNLKLLKLDSKMRIFKNLEKIWKT